MLKKISYIILKQKKCIYPDKKNGKTIDYFA